MRAQETWIPLHWVSLLVSIACFLLSLLSVTLPWYVTSDSFYGTWYFYWNNVHLLVDTTMAESRSYSYSEFGLAHVRDLNIVILVLLSISMALWLIFCLFQIVSLIRLSQSVNFKWFQFALGPSERSKKYRFVMVALALSIGAIAAVFNLTSWCIFFARPLAIKNDIGGLKGGALYLCQEEDSGPCGSFTGSLFFKTRGVSWGPSVGWGICVALTVVELVAVLLYWLSYRSLYANAQYHQNGVGNLNSVPAGYAQSDSEVESIIQTNQEEEGRQRFVHQ